MTATYIIGILISIIAFVAIGYYLWSYSMDIYEYNIFGLGTIIRGLLSLCCLFFAMHMLDLEDGSSYIWLIVAGLLWLWTFLITWVKTNFVIALLAVLFQIIAVLFIKAAINRFIETIN
jgi:hypothetical protein